MSPEINRINEFFSARSSGELNAMLAGDIPGSIKKISNAFGAELVSRDNWVRISAESHETACSAAAFLKELQQFAAVPAARGELLDVADFDRILRHFTENGSSNAKEFVNSRIKVSSRRSEIAPRTVNQLNYIKSVTESDVVFALGPAGTGKTYLAVAMAVSSLLSGKCERIILSRPAVEAGENLGYLPGGLEEKINPYLRPLYDALREMLVPDELEEMRSKGMIELAPIAFMRGRTLNKSFIILDEAQNATNDQMLMMLTRLGRNSKCIVCGDPSQTDLPRRFESGLLKAVRILSDIPGIAVCRLGKEDIMRHSLVERIARAYENSSDTGE